MPDLSVSCLAQPVAVLSANAYARDTAAAGISARMRDMSQTCETGIDASLPVITRKDKPACMCNPVTVTGSHDMSLN